MTDFGYLLALRYLYFSDQVDLGSVPCQSHSSSPRLLLLLVLISPRKSGVDASEVKEPVVDILLARVSGRGAVDVDLTFPPAKCKYSPRRVALTATAVVRVPLRAALAVRSELHTGGGAVAVSSSKQSKDLLVS